MLDVVGADIWEENLLSLKQGGRLVITGVTSGARTNIDLSIFQGRPLTLLDSGARSRGTFADMMKMVHQGSLHGIVDRTFPLNAVSKAHMVMESREFLSKLVIRINYWIHWLIENK